MHSRRILPKKIWCKVGVLTHPLRMFQPGDTPCHLLTFEVPSLLDSRYPPVVMSKVPQDESRRLFDNPILEKLTHTNSYVVITAFIIIGTAVLTYGAVSLTVPWYGMAGLFLVGYLAFTLLEYLMHRYLYHFGEYKDASNWSYKIHGVHHAFPRDKDRLAMPLPLALVLATIFFLLFKLLMGSLAVFFFPGFVVGYASYLFIHYTIHSRTPPNNWFRYLWTHHHLHHHKYEDKAFGVSTPLWDVVFGTMPPR